MEYAGLTHYEPAIGTAPEELLMYGGENGHYQEEEYVSSDDHFNSDYREGEYRESRTILADGRDRFGVSAVTFDLQEELLWMGNQGGHVTSYYGFNMEKHTSVQVHANQEVRHIHTIDDSILVLTQSTLRCQLRRGIPIFTHSSSNMVEMQCLLQTSPTSILMGGHQENLIEFDLTRGNETRLVKVGENGCAILRQHPRFVCSGDPSGQIHLRDSTSLKVEHTLDVHTGSLSDFDVHGNLLVTCGFSNRHGALAVDRYLMVYDLRILRAVNPIQMMIEPLLLRFMPSFSSRLAAVSTLGQMQLVDTVALSEPNLYVYQVNTAGSVCLALDVSSSCQSIAVGDAGGSIHIFSSNPQALFNSYSRPTEFADPVESLEPIGFDDHLIPLSIIPMPLTDEPLLSDWPEEFCKKVYRRTPQIDSEILQTMKMVGTIGYAPNLGTHRRNQVPYKLENGDKSDKSSMQELKAEKNDEPQVIPVPKEYRKIEIKYSKMGMEEFDFNRFNKTGFSGLESTLPNSYCNPMLQVLYYMEPLRAILLSHVCRKEFCLACELGFLFHMLDKSQGFPCQANNFLRAFRTIPEASALGLILQDHEDVMKKANLPRLIQSWNRFILQQIHSETLAGKEREKQRNNGDQEVLGPPQAWSWGDGIPVYPNMSGESEGKDENKQVNNSHGDETIAESTTEAASSQQGDYQEEGSLVSKLLGIRQKNINRCARCGRETIKEATVLLCNLLYPDSVNAGGKENGNNSFTDILQRSLCPEQTTPAWCDKCDKYQPTVQSRQLLALSHMLVLNCGLDNQQDFSFWQSQMDLLKKQSITDQPIGEKPMSRHIKPCRYGNKCTRSDCRFWHEGKDKVTKTQAQVPACNQWLWLPHNIKITLLAGGSVLVNVVKKDDKNKEKDKEENRIAKESVMEGNSNIQDHADVRITESAGDSVDQDLEEVIQCVEYELAAVVCHVKSNVQFEKKNLVALINVGPNYHERSMGSPVSQWYIFNDFCIVPVAQTEATSFNPEWKIPCVFYYKQVDMPPELEVQVVNPITADVFLEDKSLAPRGERRTIGFMPLLADEMPSQGDLVAMDAEFVTLNQEVAELRSDGKLSTIKPSHMSVARITCIRGQGPLEGIPFLDDYISTQEHVVDYLTKFSGIKPGDLDANYSSQHLTTLKCAYLKLRLLVDIGVKFVGHGLKNDFRVINLVVPADQVIDTVHLFHLPRQRMVSLRFLAWHFLSLKIQSLTHDSVEDARTALQLYRKYEELMESDMLQSALDELYKVGKKLHWQVPGVEED